VSAVRAATVAIAAVALALPAGAAASDAHVFVHVDQGKACSIEPAACVHAELRYEAGDGEANDVQLVRDGSSIRVLDSGATIRAHSGCVNEGPSQARCSPPEGPSMGIVLVRARLGGLGDRLVNSATAQPTLVEGGAGDDQLTGGDASDTLVAGAGRDRLEGRAGFDYLYEGEGGDTIEPDVLDGGDGSDSVSYGGRSARVVVDLISPSRPSGERGEGDSLASIEQATGGAGPDVMSAGPERVVLSGGRGKDRLHGGFGNDRLFGDEGDDKLYGGGGRDRLVGGTGDDGIRAGCGPAKLFGQAGNDRLYSLNGAADRLIGGPGRDFARHDQVDDVRQVERPEPRLVDACAL
jgi:Ca2+-binding RTX toxin-like protein